MGASDAPASAEQQEQGPVEQRRPDMRLSRDQRVLESRVFKEAFDHGPHHAGRLMVMWLAGGSEAALRLGVVASKRSFRRAADRARAKRLLREAYRLNRHRLSGNWDAILVARRPILGASRQDVERDLMALAAKAGMIGKGP